MLAILRFTEKEKKDSFGLFSKLLSSCAASQSDSELYAWLIKQNNLSSLLNKELNDALQLSSEVSQFC